MRCYYTRAASSNFVQFRLCLRLLSRLPLWIPNDEGNTVSSEESSYNFIVAWRAQRSSFCPDLLARPWYSLYNIAKRVNSSRGLTSYIFAPDPSTCSYTFVDYTRIGRRRERTPDTGQPKGSLRVCRPRKIQIPRVVEGKRKATETRETDTSPRSIQPAVSHCEDALARTARPTAGSPLLLAGLCSANVRRFLSPVVIPILRQLLLQPIRFPFSECQDTVLFRGSV